MSSPTSWSLSQSSNKISLPILFLSIHFLSILFFSHKKKPSKNENKLKRNRAREHKNSIIVHITHYKWSSNNYKFVYVSCPLLITCSEFSNIIVIVVYILRSALTSVFSELLNIELKPIQIQLNLTLNKLSLSIIYSRVLRTRVFFSFHIESLSFHINHRTDEIRDYSLNNNTWKRKRAVSDRWPPFTLCISSCVDHSLAAALCCLFLLYSSTRTIFYSNDSFTKINCFYASFVLISVQSDRTPRNPKLDTFHLLHEFQIS